MTNSTTTPTTPPITLETKVILVTPDLARQWLEAHNTHNRYLSKPLVARYAAAMRRGEWRLNADPIRFDEHGVLLDGQHRLAAVVDAETSIHALVVSGLDPAAQDTMDLGRKRSLADVLLLRGEAHPYTLAAALHVLYRLEHNRWTNADAPSFAQSLGLLDTNPDLRASLPIGERVYRHTKMRPSIAAALHYHFSWLGDDQAPADAKDFFERLATGVDLGEGSPILALRKLLDAHRNDRKSFGTARVTALTIKAWNAYRDGVQVKLLRWAPGGANPEAFPKAR